MSKKAIYTILAALFIFGVLFLLWSWLFSGNGSSILHYGQFGTGSTTSQTGGNNTPGGNYTVGLGQNGNAGAGSGQNAANGQIPLNGTGGSNGTGGTNGAGTGNSQGTGATAGTGATLAPGGTVTPGNGPTIATVNPNGVIWTNGGNVFTPIDVNSIANGSGGFAPTISSNPSGGSSGTTLIAALAATAIAGSLKCALPSAVAAISGVGTGASAGGAAASLTFSATGAPVSDLGAHAALAYIAGTQTTQNARNAAKDTNSVANCLINVIAKVALQQITISVVNWINSGFNGQPSFVNNFQQFFTNVADLAAGQFIQGTALSFLCSPFKLQIKVAIAQSYANRGAQSCSLTGIINNINNFMNGSFSTQGGWPGLLTFTTVPTNNPYGAFAYAQAGLSTAQANATANAKNNISPTGFLNLQQVYGCTDSTQNGIGVAGSIGVNAQAAQAAGSAALGQNCKTKVVTPGTVIENSLNSTNDTQIKQLGLANDIDQIISALTTQLMTKILQNGLTSLSQGTTQTAADLAAQQQAATLLLDMQNRVAIAQQVGTIFQNSIGDIQNTQNNLNTLANCWATIASSTSSSASTASQNEANALSTLTSLDAQVELLNGNITAVNAQIAALNGFQAQLSAAATQADVINVNSGYSAAVAAGNFPSQADITTAQQNRTTLQSQMAALNQSTQTSLQQCQATH